MSLISKNRHNRVMVFIDLRNVLRSVELQAVETRLDLYAMTKQLVGPRDLVAAYVFDTRMPLDVQDSSRRFHDKLRYDGFRVVAREAYDPQRNEQKEVDVAMACEMVVHALRGHYDVAIVVSGDRDFIPAIQHVQAAGKMVEVAAFAKSVSNEVIRSADRFHKLETMPLLQMYSPDDEVFAAAAPGTDAKEEGVSDGEAD
ncbi:MAG: NYN domain-containing protein [Thermoplasmatales archaeon]|nr:NYN domain-containing protein [Thermoplasmatales archaeon]